MNASGRSDQEEAGSEARPASGAGVVEVPFRRFLLYFLELGSLGFGGPIATVGYMQRDLVESRRWMSKQDLVDDEQEERGVIINTASIAAFEGQIGQVAYTASKAAIAGMCLTMARDLGSLGIRVLAIAPSLFATGLTEGIPDEFAKALTKDAAFPKRLGKPEEFAKLALAIVENPMLNGQCIRLDAGQRFAPK